MNSCGRCCVSSFPVPICRLRLGPLLRNLVIVECRRGSTLMMRCWTLLAWQMCSGWCCSFSEIFRARTTSVDSLSVGTTSLSFATTHPHGFVVIDCRGVVLANFSIIVFRRWQGQHWRRLARVVVFVGLFRWTGEFVCWYWRIHWQRFRPVGRRHDQYGFAVYWLSCVWMAACVISWECWRLIDWISHCCCSIHSFSTRPLWSTVEATPFWRDSVLFLHSFL